MNATAALPIVGVDLAKTVFQLAIADANWRVVERQRLTRTQFERWFVNRAISLVVMEACGSAHHWARWLSGLGIEVRLLPAPYVRAPADWVVPIPAGLTPLEAMTIGTAGFTAALSIVEMETNGLTPGAGPVIVTGATGGVGCIAVEILAGLGYQVTALTGKDDRHDFLRSLGAKDVLSRHTLAMGTKPLEKSLWAGAVDPVGGETLAWLTRTMGYGGSIASSGLTGGTELKTTVLPFILRGVKLLGIDSVMCPMRQRLEVWKRLATGMKPRHLGAIAREVTLAGLPAVFSELLKGAARGRTVVKLT